MFGLFMRWYCELASTRSYSSTRRSSCQVKGGFECRGNGKEPVTAGLEVGGRSLYTNVTSVTTHSDKLLSIPWMPIPYKSHH